MCVLGFSDSHAHWSKSQVFDNPYLTLSSAEFAQQKSVSWLALFGFVRH